MLSALSIDQLAVLPIAIAAFIVLLSVIVFFHEYGHFSVARFFGVRVDTFSIGFGKPIARWTDRHGTEWRIAALPLGGYVKFFGDANAASAPSDAVQGDGQGEVQEHRGGTQFPRADADAGKGMTPEEKAVCYHFKPVGVRAAIVAAGPIANFILSAVIFWGLIWWLGQDYYEPVIGDVLDDSAAAEAGFAPGDRVLAINGREIRRFTDISSAVQLGAGDRVAFEVERGGQTLVLEATPRRVETEDVFGNKVQLGQLGVRPDPRGLATQSFGPINAIAPAIAKVGDVLKTTFRFIGRLIRGKEDASQLGGPLRMAKYAGQSALFGFDESAYAEPPTLVKQMQTSLAMFINLAAVVSVSIGFLNLLPVPVLDGGHLMYYAYEAVAGRPLGPRAQAFGFRLGLVMLASLMLFVTWNDINALLVGG
ncbi:MAG: RIP metalloprotease [Pseudomonadota bacterium]